MLMLETFITRISETTNLCAYLLIGDSLLRGEMKAKLIERLKGGVAAHACNTCIWEVGATGWVGLGNIINLRLAWIKTWSLEKPNKRGLAKWLGGKLGCLLSDDASLRTRWVLGMYTIGRREHTTVSSPGFHWGAAARPPRNNK